MNAFEFLTLILAVGLALTAAGWDLYRRRIPNWLSFATLACGLVLVIIGESWASGVQHLYHFGLALVIGLNLFALGWWGGGDGKFYAAVALWFPISAFFQLVLWISLAGALLVAWAFLKRRGKKAQGLDQSSGVPYGVAIAAGMVLTLASGIAQA